MREALFVAAPDLEQQLELWEREPGSKRGRRVELALARYYSRMAGRATPFGLFAGTSMGRIAAETHLEIESRGEYRRHTRLDMDYLVTLAEALCREPSLKEVVVFHPNSSLYRAGGRVRYVESRSKGKRRTYHLVAADETDYLTATLERARGATAAELATALVDDDISRDEAEAYIAELIENQVLVPNLTLPITGPEPIHRLIGQLSESGGTSQVIDRLSRTRAELSAIDASGLGVERQRYHSVAATLGELPVPVNLPTLFQVDLVKPAPAATLGGAVLEEILRGVEVLHRLSGRERRSDLERFREAFAARYEGQEVPLLEALDEEIGIGFPPGGSASNDSTPLLRDLGLLGTRPEPPQWEARDGILLRKLVDALASQAHEIGLEWRDLEAIDANELQPLPDAFAAMATVAASDDAALSRGDFQVHLRGVSGPSGASLLGRFCHADEALQEAVERHLRTEESLRPDVVFAEIVHLPEGRVGNVLLRPVLRDYEIPYLGSSGAPEERQIPVTDLRVSVRDGGVRLSSARLGREVIPRLTSAHSFSYSSCGVYRFLGLLQAQGTALWLGWDWSVLGAIVPFTPRVVMGRLVLSPARWRVSRQEIERLSASEAAAQFQVIAQWRAERRLPRWVALADADNLLPIDLDNVLCVDMLVRLIKHRSEALVVELFPGPGELCARGPEGRFVHELIVPFVRRSEGDEPIQATSPRPAAVQRMSRRFAPGSEWLYAKLYTGTAAADQLLRDVVKPLTEEVIESAAVENWFFVRYGDPDWHLRLRFKGASERLHAEVLPALRSAAASLLEDGRVWRLQLDTYEREIERYGGLEGIELAERLFHVDSEAVLEILELLEPGDVGLDERWRLTLLGMDQVLENFGFDLATKHAVVEAARSRFAKEFRVDEWIGPRLGERFRLERRDLEALLDLTEDADHPLAQGIEILQGRSRRWAPVIAELQACAQAGRLAMPLNDLAATYMHMHANRLLRAAQRAQELVIYDFLERLYASRLARASGAQ